MKNTSINAPAHIAADLTRSGVEEPKFCSFISSSAAEAMSPIVTGRSIENMLFIAPLS